MSNLTFGLVPYSVTKWSFLCGQLRSRPLFLFLAQFQTPRVDRLINDKAKEFYHKWNPRNGTYINDAILAATVLHGVRFIL